MQWFRSCFRLKDTPSTPLLVFALAILIGLCGNSWASIDQPKKITAPEFMPELPWLNVERPLTMQELRGKVVILDFWTYGCINCLHIIPDLQRLEQKYGNKLAVIGVHSPKFDHEKDIDSLRNIVFRYNLEHPIINDANLALWKLYGIHAWPTLTIIDPEGFVIGGLSGEGHYDRLDQIVSQLLDDHNGQLNDSPLPLKLEKEKFADSLLAAPGKIAISDKYIAISDSANHRVVITDHNRTIQRIFGGRVAGFVDGDSVLSRFSSPQGLAFTEHGLYVADTGNHSIRYIDIDNDKVSTVAGTGQAGHYTPSTKAIPALSISLRSPWDLAYKSGRLFIAMAGSHQIWALNTKKLTIAPFAGSGDESIRDGRLRDAAFSQPSGLSIQGEWLYVADAEVSAVRRINLKKRYVETLIGSGLFEFGDQDGSFESAKLQHVLGVAAIDDNYILITDTYNHKLKLLNLENRTIRTIAGTSDTMALNEPGGLAIHKGKVLVVDTNNRRIVRFDLTSNSLSEWPISYPNIKIAHQ